MTQSSLDPVALTSLLRAQDGLISLDQARAVGLTSSALSRRVGNPVSGWRRVLPRVYLQGPADLVDRQRSRAATLYAGDSAALTGAAALRWHRIRHLPSELATGASRRGCCAGAPAAQSRSGRSCTGRVEHHSAYVLDGVRTVPVTRALVDAAPGLSDETLLAAMCAAVNERRTNVEQLRDELALAPIRGSRVLRQALAELATGVRSVPEALARRLFASGGLPAPLINQPLWVGDRLFLPDFRWGRVIVEIDSKAFHLLERGGWARTQERRAFLGAHGYLVIPVTPQQLRENPNQVLAEILNALALFVA